ncbi:TPA: antitoxin Xre/MbcA/ParS toxin-binding domain-containing protein [Photobacterium damselae]
MQQTEIKTGGYVMLSKQLAQLLPVNLFKDDRVFLQTVLAGISGEVVKAAVSDMPEQREVFISALDTTSSNLSRFFKREELNKQQTEEVLDILRVYDFACEVFTKKESANRWLSSHVPALGGDRPSDLLITFTGRRLIMDTLLKIEYGVFS